MSLKTVYVYLLCIIVYYTSDVTSSLEEIRDEIELLKCKMRELERDYKELKEENVLLKQRVNRRLENLETQTIRQKHSLGEIWKLSSKLSTSCRYLPAEICGTCTCLDDVDNFDRYYCDCQHLIARRDCLQHLQNGNHISGIYNVTMNNLKPTQVYCDQETDGGGWTVIQRRIDGAINFYRNYDMYKEGFGSLHLEFWMGNNNIHILTIQAVYPKGSELRIDMKDWGENAIFAKYSKFKVDDEAANYALHISGYSGNAGDAMSIANNMDFFTYDRDSDRNCSINYRGAWWYGYGPVECHRSNLNGEYRWFDEKQPGFARGVIWETYKGMEYSLKAVEMKVRRIV